MTPRSTLAPVRRHFRALAKAFIPAAEGLDEAGWMRAESIVDEALLDRPAAMRRQIVVFMRLLNGVATVRYGQGLPRLAPERLRRFLGSLEGAPLLLLRRGVWGLRTLAYMGYYGQDDIRRSVGYAAAAEGWEALERDAGPWVEREDAARPEAGTLTVDDGRPHDLEPRP